MLACVNEGGNLDGRGPKEVLLVTFVYVEGKWKVAGVCCLGCLGMGKRRYASGLLIVELHCFFLPVIELGSDPKDEKRGVCDIAI